MRQHKIFIIYGEPQKTLVRLIDSTAKELLNLTKPAAEATALDKENHLYQYNVAMLAKYCHLMVGVCELIMENNYYSALVIQRSMYELKLYLRYFYKNPKEVKNYINEPKKFRVYNIIVNGAPNREIGKKEYKYYSYLCSINHPSINPFQILATSAVIPKKGYLFVLTDFTPRPDKDSYLHCLLNLLNDNKFMIEAEYAILEKVSNIKKDQKLLVESNYILTKLNYEVNWDQKRIREYYAKLKGIRLKEIDKSLAEIPTKVSEEIKKFLDNQ